MTMSMNIWKSSELLVLATYASKNGQTWEADSEDNVFRRVLNLNRPDDWYNPTNCQKEFERLSNEYSKTCPTQVGDDIDYESLVKFQKEKQTQELLRIMRINKEKYKRNQILKEKINNKTITKEELKCLRAERLSLMVEQKDEKSSTVVDDYETTTEPSSPYDREGLMTVEKEAENVDEEMQLKEEHEEKEEQEEDKMEVREPSLQKETDLPLDAEKVVEVVPTQDLENKSHEDTSKNDEGEYKLVDEEMECDEISKVDSANSTIADADVIDADAIDADAVGSEEMECDPVEAEKLNEDVQKVTTTIIDETEKDDVDGSSPPASPIISNNNATSLPDQPHTEVEAEHTEETTLKSPSSVAPLVVEKDEDIKTQPQDPQDKSEDDSDKISTLPDNSTTSDQVSETSIKEEVKEETNTQQEAKPLHKEHDAELDENSKATTTEISDVPSTSTPEQTTEKPVEDVVGGVDPQNEVEIKKEMIEAIVPATDKDNNPDETMSIADSQQSFTTDHNVTDLNLTSNLLEEQATSSEQGNKQDLESLKDESIGSSKTSRNRRRVKQGKRRLRQKPKQVSNQSPCTPPVDQNSHSEDEDKARRMWKNSTLGILKQINGSGCSDIFSTPVRDRNAPNYSRVIHEPMDLQTMKRKLETGQITTSASFKHSLIMMVQNAVMYNQYKDAVYEKALELLDAVNHLVQDQNKKDQETVSLNTKRTKRAAAKQGEIKTEKMYK